MFRKRIGNGGKSGASHGDENGPAAAPASSSRRSGGGAPRQSSATRVPRDGGPVEVEPEPGPVRHERAAVAQLELGREQLVKARRGRSPEPCTRARPDGDS